MKRLLLVPLVLLLASCAAAPLSPTPTAAPSATPPPLSLTPSPSASATLAPPSSTPTVDPASPDALSCRIRSQSVPNGSSFDPKTRFDVSWQVENRGLMPWDPQEIRFTYFGGSPLHASDSALRVRIEPRGRVSLIVPMIAPRASGTYATSWALWYGDRDFCHMNVTIVVR